MLETTARTISRTYYLSAVLAIVFATNGAVSMILTFGLTMQRIELLAFAFLSFAAAGGLTKVARDLRGIEETTTRH